MSKKEFENFKDTLERFRPGIKLEIVQCDDALEWLGFCNSAPCVVNIYLTEEEIDNLMDDLMQLEIDAYNTETGEDPLPNDPLYLEYKEFGWLWDYFYNAEWVDDENVKEEED